MQKCTHHPGLAVIIAVGRVPKCTLWFGNFPSDIPAKWNWVSGGCTAGPFVFLASLSIRIVAIIHPKPHSNH